MTVAKMLTSSLESSDLHHCAPLRYKTSSVKSDRVSGDCAKMLQGHLGAQQGGSCEAGADGSGNAAALVGFRAALDAS